MHRAIKIELKKYRHENKEFLNTAKIAELGALIIRGTPRRYLPPLTGFDIASGDGVDVVISPGVIPEEHVGQYDLVVSSSSFTYCPQPELYKKQILNLLKPNGVLWISMCSPQCKRHHTTSKNEYGFTDCFRMTRKELCRFLKPELVDKKCYLVGDSHHQDIIYIGNKA